MSDCIVAALYKFVTLDRVFVFAFPEFTDLLTVSLVFICQCLGLWSRFVEWLEFLKKLWHPLVGGFPGKYLVKFVGRFLVFHERNKSARHVGTTRRND